MRVLFLCTGNSARSQMAEAILRHVTNGRVDVVSAGSSPAADVHPLTKATLKARYGIDASRLKPKAASAFAGQQFDAVITVCDATAAACPTWPGAQKLIHWSIDDPAAVQGAEAQRRAFDAAARELDARIRSWLAESQTQNS
jgi:ArsR family transcriptional regulator, arsenate/arsenite/antimonite-responsive transcriptional repressor / arsenate reductase (thioredoxin)